MLNQNLPKWGPRTHVLICFPHNSFILWSLETSRQVDLWSPFQILTLLFWVRKYWQSTMGIFSRKRNENLTSFRKQKKNQLFEEASQEASGREPRAEGLTPKARLAGLQAQGRTARLPVSFHLPAPMLGELSVSWSILQLKVRCPAV